MIRNTHQGHRGHGYDIEQPSRTYSSCRVGPWNPAWVGPMPSVSIAHRSGHVRLYKAIHIRERHRVLIRHVLWIRRVAAACEKFVHSGHQLSDTGLRQELAAPLLFPSDLPTAMTQCPCKSPYPATCPCVSHTINSVSQLLPCVPSRHLQPHHGGRGISVSPVECHLH